MTEIESKLAKLELEHQLIKNNLTKLQEAYNDLAKEVRNLNFHTGNY